MIFITVGSQKFQFDRLLKEIDSLIERKIISSEVFAQIGNSSYIPKYYKSKKFLDRDEFTNIIQRSTIVITHGGTGAIVNAIKKNKKVIAVPRLERYGEHVDNHQEEIVKMFRDMNLIESVNDISDLEKKILRLDDAVFKSYKSNTENVIRSIEEYINS